MTLSLCSAVRTQANLERSWRVIAANARTSKSENVRLEIEVFSESPTSNLKSIQSILSAGTFKFIVAKGVPLPKLDARGNRTGKFRPIVLAPVESRIVQRAILNVLYDVPGLKPYIETPYSFGGIRSLSNKDDRKTFSRMERISAVPAAIQSVLEQIKCGNRYIVTADIQQFFTRISKSQVREIVGSACPDDKFMALFDAAIDVELSNLAELREKSDLFPIEDIGVAQGNSLSPLLGNIALARFDEDMNKGDCKCIRYIDDFIIIAPTEAAANARLRKSKKLLDTLGMKLLVEKSSAAGKPVEQGFEFLGISIKPGLIRPFEKARAKFVSSVQQAFRDGCKSMRNTANGAKVDHTKSLIGTLKRVNGMLDGWGKHYWFCNDRHTMSAIDVDISTEIASFLGEYRSIRLNSTKDRHTGILGMTELAKLETEPFSYPRKSQKV